VDTGGTLGGRLLAPRPVEPPTACQDAVSLPDTDPSRGIDLEDLGRDCEVDASPDPNLTTEYLLVTTQRDGAATGLT
jgi:hypothetical protein